MMRRQTGLQTRQQRWRSEGRPGANPQMPALHLMHLSTPFGLLPSTSNRWATLSLFLSVCKGDEERSQVL